MVLHTIISEYAVFDVPQEPSQWKRCSNGAYLMGTGQEGTLRIQRIVSTDPADYLRFSPGEAWPES